MPIFSLHNFSFRYHGVDVLKNISLTIRNGEKVAFVGESGAGKSTLLNLLYKQRRQGTALIPQDFGLVDGLSVFHNVYMGRLDKNTALYNLANLAHPFASEVATVRPVVERLGLTEKLFEPVGSLSGGQKQRTAIARAIHQQGSVVVGDEPVSAVDEFQARSALKYMCEKYDTVLFAMHDVGLALEYADRVIGLIYGRIAIDQPTQNMCGADLDNLYVK